MPTPPLSREICEAAVNAVNKALGKGYRPPGVTGTGPGAYAVAADALGIGRQTFQNRMSVAKRDYGLAPDLSLWTPAEYRMVKEMAPAKPKVIVRQSRESEPEGPTYTVLALGDMHCAPSIPNDRFKWIGRFAAERKPEYIVDMGDSLTFDSLCRHIGNETHQGRLKGVFLDDITHGREALSLLNEQLGYQPKKYKVRGNHEQRLFNYENQNPEAFGMFSQEYKSMLEATGWAENDYGEFLFIGGVGFVHVPLNQRGKEYGGKNSETQIANDTVFDTVFGHSHRKREWRAAKIGPSKHVTIVNTGCGLPWGHIEDYAMHATTGWWWGVCLLKIRGGHIQETEYVSMQTLAEKYS